VDGIYVSIFNSDGTTYSNGQFRGTAFIQEKILLDNVVYQTNILPRIRPLNAGLINIANVNPQGFTAYWKKGTFIFNRGVSSSGAIGWICIEGGRDRVGREVS